MAYTLHITLRASHDIYKHAGKLATAKNDATADHWLTVLHDQLSSLKTMPELGALLAVDCNIDRDLRSIFVGTSSDPSCHAIYAIAKKSVYVLAVQISDDTPTSCR